MLGGALGRRAVAETAVGALLVVIPTPFGDQLPSVVQAGEPVIVEAFIPEAAVEAFDEGVLGGLAGLNQFELDAVPIGPLVQCPPRELWPLVGSDSSGIAAEGRDAVEDAGDIGAADGLICDDVDGFPRVVIDHGQALDPAAAGQRIEDEIHRPDLVRRSRHFQWFPVDCHAVTLATSAHGEARIAIDPVHALVVRLHALAAQ